MSSISGPMLVRRGASCCRSRLGVTVQGRRYIYSEPIIGPDTIIPPESPRFVYIPESPQIYPEIKRQRKGTLPIPRSPLQVKQKDLEFHLENTAPEAVVIKETGPQQDKHKDLTAWKAEESRLRRENFVAGYQTLRHREQENAKRVARRLRRGAAEKKAKQHAPEKDYEQTSRPSVLSFMTSPQIWKAPKMSKEELAERRAKFKIREQNQEHELQARMHALYMNAKGYIVNGEQLEKRLDEAFNSDFYEFNKTQDFGIWDERGWPEDTTYLMNQNIRTARGQNEGFAATSRRRIIKVTEEMTGGKLAFDKPAP